jgi:hypothetical protein
MGVPPRHFGQYNGYGSDGYGYYTGYGDEAYYGVYGSYYDGYYGSYYAMYGSYYGTYGKYFNGQYATGYEQSNGNASYPYIFYNSTYPSDLYNSSDTGTGGTDGSIYVNYSNISSNYYNQYNPYYPPVDPLVRAAETVQSWFGMLGGVGPSPLVLSSGPGCPPSIVVASGNSSNISAAPGGPAALCSMDGIMGSSSVPGVLDQITIGENCSIKLLTRHTMHM